MPSALTTIRKVVKAIISQVAPGAGVADRDERQLRSLAVAFYLTAFFAVLASCVSIPNFLVAFFFTAGPLQQASGVEVTPERVLILTLAMLAICASLILIERFSFFTAQSISQRRRLPFIKTMLCVAVLFVPVGPLVCLYGFRLLRRPSVLALFKANEAP